MRPTWVRVGGMSGIQTTFVFTCQLCRKAASTTAEGITTFKGWDLRNVGYSVCTGCARLVCGSCVRELPEDAHRCCEGVSYLCLLCEDKTVRCAGCDSRQCVSHLAKCGVCLRVTCRQCNRASQSHSLVCGRCVAAVYASMGAPPQTDSGPAGSHVTPETGTISE